MKKLVIGILAHVDAGKTTLSEELLYLCGEIRKIGRVDHGDGVPGLSGVPAAQGVFHLPGMLGQAARGHADVNDQNGRNPGCPGGG